MEIIIPNSFRVLIIGPSGCGKTHLLMNILNMIPFDKLFLFSRSIHQDYYQTLIRCHENFLPRNVIENIFNEPPKSMEELDQIINEIVNDEEFETSETEFESHDSLQELKDPSEIDETSNNVIIFDDLIDEKQSDISKYFTRGRHNNINTFYLSQSYFQIPRKTIRGNCNFLIFFKLPLRDVVNIFNDIAGSDMNIKEFKSLCKFAWAKTFGFLIIDLTKDIYEGKYKIGFHKIFVPKTEPF